MKKWDWWIAAVVLVLSLPARSMGQSGPVGQVLMAQGNVEIQHGKTPTYKCLGLDQLRAGDLLSVVGKGAATVVLYENGARYGLAGGSIARVERDRLRGLAGPTPKPLKALSRAFIRPLAQPVQRFSSKFAGEVARPAEDPNLGPRHPWPTCALRETAAVLRWEGPMGTDTESLRLRIREAGAVKPICEIDLPVTARDYPVPARLLKPGRWYGWSVTAVGGSGAGKACEGQVRLLTAGERAEVEQMEREAETIREADRDDPSPDLLLGQVYERLGLYEDAVSAYQSALRFGPNAGVEAEIKALGVGYRVSENPPGDAFILLLPPICVWMEEGASSSADTRYPTPYV